MSRHLANKLFCSIRLGFPKWQRARKGFLLRQPKRFIASLAELPLFGLSDRDRHILSFLQPHGQKRKSESTQTSMRARLPVLSAHHRWKKEGDSAAALRNNNLVSKSLWSGTRYQLVIMGERSGKANSEYTDCVMEIGKNTKNVRKDRLKKDFSSIKCVLGWNPPRACHI